MLTSYINLNSIINIFKTKIGYYKDQFADIIIKNA